MTFRAVNVLKEADLILAEDTRTSGKLLKHYDIGTPMQSHHMHNEHKTVARIIARLISGVIPVPRKPTKWIPQKRYGYRLLMSAVRPSTPSLSFSTAR